MKRTINYLITLFVNLLLNLKWSIPAWILLMLHIYLGWSILLFWIALGLWILNSIFWMHFISWARSCDEVKNQQPNKNPYSKNR